MTSPHDPESELVTVTLPKDDYQLFMHFISILKRVDGWCSVNRAIGKFILFVVITALIMFSQGFDAIKNLFGWKH